MLNKVKSDTARILYSKWSSDMSRRLSFLPGEVSSALSSNNEWREVSRGHSRENVPKCQGQLKIVGFRQDKNVGFWQLYL